MPSKQHPSLFPNVQAFGLQAHVFFEQCLDFLRMLVQDVIEDVGGNHVHTHSRCDGYLLQLAVGFVRDADNFPVLHLVVNQVVGELLLPYPFFFLLLLLLFRFGRFRSRFLYRIRFGLLRCRVSSG